MGVMVYSSLWVMQDLHHQPCYVGAFKGIRGMLHFPPSPELQFSWLLSEFCVLVGVWVSELVQGDRRNVDVLLDFLTKGRELTPTLWALP